MTQPINEDAIQNLLTRRSVRSYLPDPVPEDLIELVMACGTYAPTAMNYQSPLIVAVTNKELRDRLSAMNAAVLNTEGTDPFYGAPVVLVVLANKEYPCAVYDGSLVMGNLMNAAHACGLGSCWINRAKQEFETPEGKQILADLGIEGEWEGIGHCILGYSAEPEPEPKPRKADYCVWAR